MANLRGRGGVFSRVAAISCDSGNEVLTVLAFPSTSPPPPRPCVTVKRPVLRDVRRINANGASVCDQPGPEVGEESRYPAAEIS